ncbi:MAG: hypothetical protein ACRDKH_09155 [Solirubrobacterales bacterium]
MIADLEIADLDAAADFIAAHARPLDRRRFGVVVDGDGPEGALAALSSYRNPDGGYGWGLEPDLRSASSQPAPALHAFEVFEDILPATSPAAIELCDWLGSVTLADGGVPFAFPIDDAAGSAPFWVEADPTASSLQITSIVAGGAQRVAAGDESVAAHEWLARATEYCLGAIAATEQPAAMELAFSVRFCDAIVDREPRAEELLAKLGEHVPESGVVPVSGGLADEAMHPLDFAPYPDRPARELISAAAVAADLERLAGAQEDDGGWAVDFQSYSPAGALEWRGHATVRAATLLKRNGLA